MAVRSMDDIVTLLSDDFFYRVRTMADCDFVLYEDLNGWEFPGGMTQDEAWRLITAVRKQAAIFPPDDPYRTVDSWFVTTTVIARDTKDLELRCMAGFPLDSALETLQGSPYLTSFIERTLLQGMVADRAPITAERVHEIFAGAPVENDVERVVSNYFEISHDADDLARRDITYGLIETLYYRLVEGTDVEALPERGEVPPVDPRVLPPSTRECIDSILRRTDLESGDEQRMGPFLRIVNVTWFFWNFDVFPRFNTLVGLLLRNVLAIKWGLPVLSWLPVTYYPFGDMNTPRMEQVYRSWAVDQGFGLDFTSYFTVYAKQYLRELDKLSEAVRRLWDFNRRVGETVSGDLNERQKSIVLAVSVDPDAVLRIDPHRRTFRVAYATARSDFLDLERQGYLAREQQGRAFVFRATPELRRVLDQLHEQMEAE